MSHRILIDLPSAKVISGEHRYYKAWHSMSLRDLEFMQQILDETYRHIATSLTSRRSTISR